MAKRDADSTGSPQADETPVVSGAELDLTSLINQAETAKRDLAAKRGEKTARADARATAIAADEAADVSVADATSTLAAAKQHVLDAVNALYS